MLHAHLREIRKLQLAVKKHSSKVLTFVSKML